MFRKRIQEHYDALTPGFRKIADYVMHSTLDVAFLTASQLARQVDVDPATVVRFTQEIGYSGYREFSLEIKAYVRDQVTKNYRAVKEAGTEEARLTATLDRIEQQIRYYRMTEIATLAKAVEALKEAHCVWVTGEFISYSLADYFATVLSSTVGIPARAFHPSISEAASALREMKQGDVLLAIALGTNELETGYVLQLGRQKGVKTVCVSNLGTVLPAREADMAVVANSQNATHATSNAASLLIIDTILEVLAEGRIEVVQGELIKAQSYMSEILSLRRDTERYELHEEPTE